MNTTLKIHIAFLCNYRNSKAYLSILTLILISTGCSSPKALPFVKDDEVKVTSKTADISDEKMYYSAISDKSKIERFDGGIHIPFQDLDKLKVKRGRRSLVLEGFTGGLVAGIALGKILAPNNGDHLEGLDGIPYVLLGTGIGTMFRLVSSVDRWKKVPLDKLKISLMPNEGGAVGMGITLRLN